MIITCLILEFMHGNPEIGIGNKKNHILTIVEILKQSLKKILNDIIH